MSTWHISSGTFSVRLLLQDSFGYIECVEQLEIVQCSGCTADTDCTGAATCVNGVCTDPITDAPAEDDAAADAGAAPAGATSAGGSGSQ